MERRGVEEMRTTIYYFSGTGNSLAFARELANELGETDLVSIPEAMKDGGVDVSTPNIGFIFPVYAWGPPRIVEEFIEHLELTQDHYIFAIATCGGIPGGTLVMLNKMLKKRGGKLDIGFVIKEASYQLQEDNGLISMMKRLSDTEAFSSGKERLDEIAEAIKARRKGKLEKNPVLPRALGSMFHGTAMKMFQKADDLFYTNDDCAGCGTCARLCPRDNITMDDGRPKWNNDCEQCMACIQWCPRSAIQIQVDTAMADRGHNQAVKLADMMAD